MDQERILPDPKICRTRRMYTTQFFVCMVEAPVNCPHFNLVRGFHICNHYHRDNFAEDTPSGSHHESGEGMARGSDAP